MSMKQLPSSTVSLITSSQIITSVSSVVKELVENAIDAGALNIDVKLEDFGLFKIEVKDDGCGIRKEDTVYMAQASYTSKISDISDLEELNSYGFRGEALNALCQVAEVSLTTKTDDDQVAMTYSLNANGEITSEKPSHIAKGTIVTAYNLFCKLPVRRKYAKVTGNARSELKKSENILKMLSVIHPHLRVTFCHNKCLVWQKASVSTLRQSMLQAVGHHIVNDLEEVTTSEDNVNYFLLVPRKGLKTLMEVAQPHVECMMIYINKRPVRNKKIEQLVLRCVGKHLGIHIPSYKYITCLISLQLSSKELDVNLEPDKTRIFLRNEEKLLSKLEELLTSFYEIKFEENEEASVRIDKSNLNEEVETQSKRLKLDDSSLLIMTNNVQDKERIAESSRIIMNDVRRHCGTDSLNESSASIPEKAYKITTMFGNESGFNNTVDKKRIKLDTLQQEVTASVKVHLPESQSVFNIFPENEDSFKESEKIKPIEFTDIPEEHQTHAESALNRILNNSKIVSEQNLNNSVLENINNENIRVLESTSSDISNLTSEKELYNSFELGARKKINNDSINSLEIPQLLKNINGVSNDIVQRQDLSDHFKQTNVHDLTEKRTDVQEATETLYLNPHQHDPSNILGFESEQPCVSKSSVNQLDITSKLPKQSENNNLNFASVKVLSEHFDVSLPVENVHLTNRRENSITKDCTSLTPYMKDDTEINKSPPDNASSVEAPEPVDQSLWDACDRAMENWNKGSLKTDSGQVIQGPHVVLPHPSEPAVAVNLDLSVQSASSQLGCKEQSAFTKFSRDMRPKILEDNPGIIFTKVAGLLVDKWRNLPPEEKARYEEMAAREYHDRSEARKYLQHNVKMYRKMKAAKTKFLAGKKPVNNFKKKISNVFAEGRNTKYATVSLTSIRENLDRRKGMWIERDKDKLTIVGQSLPSGNWIYCKGKEFGVLRHWALNEVVSFHKLMMHHIVPVKILDKRIKITDKDLGEELWNLLLSLTRKPDHLTGIETVTSPGIAMNGFKIEVEKGIDYYDCYIAGTASISRYHGKEELKETLELIRDHGDKSGPFKCRPRKIIGYMQSEAVRVARVSDYELTREQVCELLKYWFQNLRDTHKMCLHNTPIFGMFYEGKDHIHSTQDSPF